MPPNSKKGKKKSKSKQHSKKNPSSIMQAKLYHESEEYPSSRIIKRAPNGDVIVESLANEGAADEINTSAGAVASPMAFTLDSHWESLSAEEKKRILRIEKDEVFDIIRNYQNSHNCNCSVCGRRHMAMDQEMERIYNTLYDIDKERDPEINPVKFHLSIIKELQTSKSLEQEGSALPDAAGPASRDAGEAENVRDDVVKYFLSPSAVGSLKEEVMHVKQSKQQQQQQLHYMQEEMVANGEVSTSAGEHTAETNVVRSPLEDRECIDETFVESDQVPDMEADDEGLQAKYLKFAKTFVSSHPKIAQEYVNRMMRYPDMRALTDDLMNNNGQGFVKAIENFVAQKQKPLSKDYADGSRNLPTVLNCQADAGSINLRNLGGAKEFTTMLHNGQPLTSEEYANLQRHVADRMTNSYDAQKKEFKEVSQLERELFTRFMFGEDRKRFGDMIMQSFREKFDDQYSTAAIGASLAAAAVTTVSPVEMPGHDEISEEYDMDFAGNEVDKAEFHDNEFEESYDEYSDYDGDEDEEDEIGADADFRSQLDEEEDDSTSINDANHHTCPHATHVEDHHGCYEHKDSMQSDSHGHHNGHYHSHHGHEDEYNDENDGYENSVDEADRLEEGRKLIQIAITKLLQGRIMESYHEKQAENNRLKLLQELEAEEVKKKAKEEKKLKKREKEKEKKKAQQLAKEEERRKREEEAEMMKKEAEEREKQRREAQRQKVEETKRKKDEERRRKLEEQRRREEEQERHRKLKEEQKRKREEEKRLKEEEKRRREEERRKREELKAQKAFEQNEEEKMRINSAKEIGQLNNTQDVFLEQPLKAPERNASSFTPIQYPSMSPNVPYGNSDTLPLHRSSINDDILVSSATASKPAPNSAGIHKLLEMNNKVPQGANQVMPNDVSMFSSSNFMQPNTAGDGLSFNNIPCMLPPASSSQNSVSNGLGGQHFGLPSWNSFGSNSSLLKSFQTNSLDIPREQCQHSASSYGINNTQPPDEEYLAKEMNNIASMLSSAGLDDSSSVPRTDLFGPDAVWGPRRDIVNNVAAGIAHGHVNDMRLGSNRSSVHLSTSDSPALRGSQQHSSIWDNDNDSLIQSNGAKTTNLTTNESANSNKLSRNIWGHSIHSSASFLAEANNPSNLLLSNVKAENEMINNGPDAEDEAYMDSIYRAYLPLRPPGSKDFVLTSLIHQNGLCHNMSYASFISYLVKMHHNYGCELLTDATGSITHARMAGPTSGPKNNQSRKLSKDVSNGGFFTEATGPMVSPLSDRPTSAVTTENVPNFSRQFFGVTQPATHSSLAGNIWG
ncbi:hypothetical protein HG536_0B02570 [Torulaspora globosa]|uniref:Stress response protein NST1 n=1 Tax=Torulaspora globosa TaxID=48254 RepID=A0A7G3ZD08_9SACH|nr:uncharacterized protein HG536_0B02570 [Torulaspora globosa]QLL31394.1 hypothetical protein HG536_0B02570 [Torulaspora globosa]